MQRSVRELCGLHILARGGYTGSKQRVYPTSLRVVVDEADGRFEASCRREAIHVPLADRCCADFISQVRSRGEQYVRENRVHFQTVYDDAVAVAVSGDSGEYEVLLDWSEARKGFVEATCTCPYFEDHGLCKHIWATIRKADAQGIGPRNGKRRLSVLEGDLDDKEDEGAADFWDSDDDDDDSYEGKGAVAPPRAAGPRPRGNRGRLPLGGINWRPSSTTATPRSPRMRAYLRPRRHARHGTYSTSPRVTRPVESRFGSSSGKPRWMGNSAS